METALPDRPVGPTLIAVLALVQSAFGVLRALHWVDVGSDLMGQGLLLIPLIGIIAFLRGAFVAAFALLYVAFACGTFLRRTWAWWIGMIAAAINLLLVVSVVAQGEAFGQALLWTIVPVIIVAYLLSRAGRQAFGN